MRLRMRGISGRMGINFLLLDALHCMMRLACCVLNDNVLIEGVHLYVRIDSCLCLIHSKGS